MEDCLKLEATKEIIEEILARHKGKDYFQCGNCCSIKSDAKELARTLYVIAQASIGSDDESVEEIGEQCSDLLGQMIEIGYPEECFSDSELFTRWINENEERCLPEIDGFEYEVFIKSRDVVLKVTDVCGCIILPLTKER